MYDWNNGLPNVGRASSGTVVFGVDSRIVALRSWVTGEISSAAHSISDVTGLQTALDAKQATLSAGAGCFLSGSTISSYTLRWNGSSVPSNPNVIQELHWSSYTVAQTINIGTGKVESSSCVWYPGPHNFSPTTLPISFRNPECHF